MQILTEQEEAPCIQPLIVTQPASADAGDLEEEGEEEEEEEDWQQLSALPHVSGPSTSSVKHSSPRSSLSMCLDHSSSGAEPMGFRELFLRSSALENLFAGKGSPAAVLNDYLKHFFMLKDSASHSTSFSVMECLNCFIKSSNNLWLQAGYAQEAPGSSEEEELLGKLVDSCLGCSSEETETLLADLASLARAQAQCQETGVPQPQIQAVSAKVSQAVTDLKRKVSDSFEVKLEGIVM